MESKRVRLIRKLYKDGWRVSDKGFVVKPDGAVRDTRLSVGKGSRTNYMKFNVKFEGSSYPVKVHQLCAYQKYGEESFLSECTRHINGDSTDNRPNNITIGTHKDNSYDRPEDVRRIHSLAAASSKRKFSDVEVEQIRSSNLSLKEISEKFGCSKSTASYIRNRKTYK